MKSTRFILLWIVNLIVAINFLPSLIAKPFDKGKMAIPYGSIIKLQHVKTGRYLAAGGAGNGVYAIDDEDDESTLWMLRADTNLGGYAQYSDRDEPKFGIKLPELILASQPNYESAAKSGIDKNEYFQRVVRYALEGQFMFGRLRLEHVKTTKDLSGSVQGNKVTIPESNNYYGIGILGYDKNGAVPNASGSAHPPYNNCRFVDLEPGTDGVLVDGIVGRLNVHSTGLLYSKNGYFFNKAKDFQEVALLGAHKPEFLEGTLFRVKLVSAPGQHNFRGLKDLWQKIRGPKLHYNTLIQVGLTATASQQNALTGGMTGGQNFKSAHKFVTFAWSPLPKEEKEPNKHVSLKAYDPRLFDRDHQEAAPSSWFLLQNADNPADNGPVKYGAKLKIFSTAVGAFPSHYGTQWKDHQGLFTTPKQWRVHQYPNAQEAQGKFTVIISDPEHEDFKKNDGICGTFSLEPAVAGIKQGEEVCQDDLLQIRSLGSVQNSKPRTLWTWRQQIFASDNDDAYGLKHYHNHRDNLFHRFRVHHVAKKEVPDKAINDFNKITRSLKQWQEEAAERAKKEEAAARAKAEAAAKAKAEPEAKTQVAEEKPSSQAGLSGFSPMPGILTYVSTGMKQVIKEGKPHHLFKAWGITKNNQLIESIEAHNPWLLHSAKDDQGNTLSAFKSVSIGFDGTTYAVTQDGNVYRYNWPNEKKSKMPTRKTKKKRKKSRRKKRKSARKKKAKNRKRAKGVIIEKK